MSRLRVVGELARADFLERARRPGFLLVLGGAAGLAYTVHADLWTVMLGGYVPAPGPATTGTLVAVVTSLFLSFAAFYVVRGTVERDVRTGVGSILAATPMTRFQYATGKLLSNMAVLGAMVLLLAALAVVMAAERAGGMSGAGARQVAVPVLLITGPGLVAVGGVAVLFDSVPGLRGTAGNVAYFFVWVGVLTFGGLEGGGALADVTGSDLVFEVLRDGLQAAHPGASARGLTVSVSPEIDRGATVFSWSGAEWSVGRLGRRLAWIGAGFGLSGLAAVALRLFDPFTDGGSPAGSDGGGVGSRAEEREEGVHRPGALPPAPDPGAGAALSGADLPPPAPAGALVSFLRTAGGEARLLLSGHSWWWILCLACVNVAALFVPAGDAGIPLLAAWILALPLWSPLGCRERLEGTESLLFSRPRPRIRQLPAQYVAGVGVSLVTASGPLLRMALGGEGAALAAAGVAALFVPALALCLGSWTGKEKTFQAVYLVLWYVGPANGVPVLDFVGITGGAALDAGAPPAFLVAGAALAVLAWVGRGRRLRAAG